jgi:hypothetical protein
MKESFWEFLMDKADMNRSIFETQKSFLTIIRYISNASISSFAIIGKVLGPYLYLKDLALLLGDIPYGPGEAPHQQKTELDS